MGSDGPLCASEYSASSDVGRMRHQCLSPSLYQFKYNYEKSILVHNSIP